MKAVAAFLLAASCHSAAAQTAPFEEDLTTELVRAQAHSMSVFWGDYDGDGDLDVLVANTLEDDMLFRNELRGDEPQQGVFTPFTLNELNLPPGAVNGGGWFDIDGDGDLDIATTSIYGAALLINTGDGSVPFVYQPSVLDQFDDVRDLAPGDFDLDGDVDLVLLRRGYRGNALIVNDAGVLTLSESPLSQAFDDVATGCWGYLDADHYPELFVGNVTLSNNRMYLNDGGVLIQDEESPTSDPLGTQSCAWGDFDGDGDFDLFTGKEHSFSGIPNPAPLRNALYRNDDGILVPIDMPPVTTDNHRSIGAAWGDIDNDGDLDLVVSNHDALEMVYVNDGAGGFTSFGLGELQDGRSMGISLVDDDEDGDLDLYVANGGPRTDLPVEHNRYFRNTTDADTTRHWLQVDLRGNESDRFGVGARVRAYVTVDDAPRSYLRAVSGRPWRLAHDGYRMHFGLGPATWVDSLVIEWPRGGGRTIIGLRVDSVYTIPQDPEIVGTIPAPPPRDVAVRVVPNPVRADFAIVAHGVADGEVWVEIIDVLGRRVATLSGIADGGTARFGSLSIRLPAGRYVARVLENGASTALTVL